MKELIGKKILELKVSADESSLIFITDAGSVWYETEGDCCSTSWFADVTGVQALIGGVVVSSEEVSMDSYNVNDGRGRSEEDQAYGYKLTTDKGYVDIVFRNSSNGYYGGWMSLRTGEPPKDTRPITDDWQA
jgi:hypothetical protein